MGVCFDCKCVLDNDEDKVTKYSFSQLNEFYEGKVKKLRPKTMSKCADILEKRNQLEIQLNLLTNNFQKFLMDQANLQEKKKNIKETNQKNEC